jgi:tetratricopeptide (TPR) repeat protein
VKNRKLHLLFLILCPALLYSLSLPGEFVYDDIAITVVENPALSGKVSIREVLQWDRPVREFTYMFDHALWGYNPLGYHLQNILWHTANTLLLYYLLILLGLSSGGSFFTALIFALHPIQTESVAWISGRKELLCLFFEISTCYLFIFSVLHQPALTKRNILLYCLSLFTLLLALLSKQVAVMTPFLMLLCGWLYLQNHKQSSWRKFLLRMAPHLLLMLAFMLFRFDVINELEFVQERGTFYDPSARETEYTMLSAILTPLATFGKSIWLLIFPWDLTVERAFQPVESLADLRWLGGLCTLLFFSVPALWYWRRKPALLFGLLWFLLSWAPVSGAVPVAYLLADRYLYIPSIGFFILAYSLIRLMLEYSKHICPATDTLLLRRSVWVTILTLILLAFSIRSAFRIPDWRSEISLWQSAIAARPDYAALYASLANAFAQQGNLERAQELWRQSLEMEPNQPMTWVNIGVALKQAGKLPEAEQAYLKAIELYPEYGAAHFNLALVLEAQGRQDEALEHFHLASRTLYGKQSTELRKGLAHYHIARIHFERRDFQQARLHIQRAEALAPRLAQVQLLKGLLYTDAYPIAREALLTAIRLSPEYADAWFNLGVLEWQKGDPQRAMEYWAKAMELNPDLKTPVEKIRGK